MPIRTHLSAKSGAKSGVCGRGAARFSASRRGGSKRRRSVIRSTKLDVDEFDSTSTSSVDSSGSYQCQTQGRSGVLNGMRSGTRSRTAASDSSSRSPTGGPDQSMFTNISSGSDEVFRRYESMMKKLSSPSGDHARLPQQRKSRQTQQPDAASSTSAQPLQYGDKSRHASRPRSRHRRDLHSSAKNASDGSGGGRGFANSGNDDCGGSCDFRGEGDGGGGRCSGEGDGGGGRCSGEGDGGGGRCSGEEGGGNRKSGGARQRLGSPSGSYTRSGEPSSQVAYQAALSPLTTASSDEHSMNATHNRRTNKGQVVRLAVRDANTSNRQQSTRRRGSPPQSSPQQGHRRHGTRSTRDQFSKHPATPWDDNFSNQSEIYDKHSRRCEEPRDKKCSTHSEKIRSKTTSEQHQQRQMLHGQQQRRQPHDPQSDSIYSGNHVESDVLKRNKSLRRLYSLRSRHYDDTGRRQKGEDRREERGLLSEEESDCDELSPKAWQACRSRQQQQPPQQQQMQMSSQRQPLPRQNKATARSSGHLRGDEYLYDAYRSNIYNNCEEAPVNQRAGGSNRSWLPHSTPAGWRTSPPAFDRDVGDAGEVPRGVGDGDIQPKRRLAGRGDRHDRLDVFDKFEKLDSRSKRRNFAFQSNQSSDEEDAWRPPPSPTGDYRACPDPESWVNRRDKKVGAVEPASQHWCNNGRMRETRSRRQTLFSCPYMSLSLQTKTYECDRCAGYLPCTNNLNCDPNREDSTSQDSAVPPEQQGAHATGRRAQRAGREPLGRCQKLERTENVRRHKRDVSSNSID